ncbi:MAG: T9SS type A sorting domain-containing protein [Bacteroidia bacterium]|nr:T9SS type A sorting domain-containing protein [Bacteroidia bacterium]
MKTTLLTMVTAFLLSTTLQAATHVVQVKNFEFDPQDLFVNVGDTITWNWVNGNHTTTSDSVPAGALSWNNPITSASPSFSYIVTEEGIYSYICTVHVSMGMIGTITATSSTGIPSMKFSDVFFTIGNSNPSGAIMLNYVLSAPEQIQLCIMDLDGKIIQRHSENYPAGNSTAIIQTGEIPKGIYLIEAIAGNRRQVARCVLN